VSKLFFVFDTTPISRYLETSFSVHDSIQRKDACFWVSVNRMHRIVVPVKFDGGLSMSSGPVNATRRLIKLLIKGGPDWSATKIGNSCNEARFSEFSVLTTQYTNWPRSRLLIGFC
jgi:hypothetical protein